MPVTTPWKCILGSAARISCTLLANSSQENAFRVCFASVDGIWPEVANFLQCHCSTMHRISATDTVSLQPSILCCPIWIAKISRKVLRRGLQHVSAHCKPLLINAVPHFPDYAEESTQWRQCDRPGSASRRVLDASGIIRGCRQSTRTINSVNKTSPCLVSRALSRPQQEPYRPKRRSLAAVDAGSQ